MTDNQTTELRKMLDERGVEYEVTFFETFTDTEWCVNDASCTYTDLRDTNSAYLTILDITPEQAIAATLGNERGTCHAENDLSEWVCSNCQCWIPLGLTPENIKHASEWRYCPHCGAEVVNND